MRQTRVLYVEDDPTLREIMSRLLRKGHSLEITTADNSREAGDLARDSDFDVALLDLALGAGSATGLELAFALRRLQPNLGIVLYSQHAGTHLQSSMAGEQLESWSIIQKSASLDMGFLVKTLKSTALGFSVIDPALDSKQSRPNSAVESLGLRQREIMSHLAAGADATLIAERLGLSPVTIRQELSKIYKLLVPNPAEGTDLRTSAVVRYLRETQSYAWQNTK